MPPLIEPLKNLVLQANQTEEWVSCDNWSEMKSFLQKAGLNRLVRSQTLTVSFKKPWNFLAENTVAAQRATTESERNLEWWSRQESNLRPSHCERDALPTELRPHSTICFTGLRGALPKRHSKNRPSVPKKTSQRKSGVACAGWQENRCQTGGSE